MIYDKYADVRKRGHGPGDIENNIMNLNRTWFRGLVNRIDGTQYRILYLKRVAKKESRDRRQKKVGGEIKPTPTHIKIIYDSIRGFYSATSLIVHTHNTVITIHDEYQIHNHTTCDTLNL
uniref:Uncharacterized protein n=1 Tax=Cacopsylla melanoneura TaxID=428564 RepID=A0A8D8Z017_9HEMI